MLIVNYDTSSLSSEAASYNGSPAAGAPAAIPEVSCSSGAARTVKMCSLLHRNSCHWCPSSNHPSRQGCRRRQDAQPRLDAGPYHLVGEVVPCDQFHLGTHHLYRKRGAESRGAGITCSTHRLLQSREES